MCHYGNATPIVPHRKEVAALASLTCSTRLAAARRLCCTDVVVVYGIASSVSHDVEDFHATAEEAEATVVQILADEPELEGALWVEPVELDLSAN
jgi:hypothetical protein